MGARFPSEAPPICGSLLAPLPFVKRQSSPTHWLDRESFLDYGRTLKEAPPRYVPARERETLKSKLHSKETEDNNSFRHPVCVCLLDGCVCSSGYDVSSIASCPMLLLSVRVCPVGVGRACCLLSNCLLSMQIRPKPEDGGNVPFVYFFCDKLAFRRYVCWKP